MLTLQFEESHVQYHVFDEEMKAKSTNLKNINIYNLMLSSTKINIEPKDIVLGNRDLPI